MPVERVRERIDEIYRSDSRRVLATLIRLLGDFDRAEEAMQDAFAAALDSWPAEGVPANPRAWLVSTGRFKAIDRLRRASRFDAAVDEITKSIETSVAPDADSDREEVEDDRLRLIFTCCHPALSSDARIALTLREVCGLETEELARAFLIPAPTLAQRIVRAKNKIRDAHIPYQVPSRDKLPGRLDVVLHVLYLVFTEGYSASFGDNVVRHDLSAEGELILLDEQDRSLWNREQIQEGLALVDQALASRRFGPYTLQAAIAAVHAEATTAEATDWRQIIGIYD